jgi:hypothetical protein
MDRLIGMAEEYCGGSDAGLQGWSLAFHDGEIGCGLDLNPFDQDVTIQGCANRAPWWLGGDIVTIRLSAPPPDVQCIERTPIIHELCHVFGWDDGYGPLAPGVACKLWGPVAEGIPECWDQFNRYKCWW